MSDDFSKGFPTAPGRRLQYTFARAFENVVGLDATVDVKIPAEATSSLHPGGIVRIPVVDAGSSVALEIFLRGPLPPLPRFANIVLNIEGETIIFRGRGLVHDENFRLRARWHTTGQAHLWINNRLVAYEPSLSPGVSFSVDHVATGSPHLNSGAFVVVSFMYVKLLRHDDAIQELAKYVPLDLSGVDESPCVQRAHLLLNEMVRDCRSFMSGVLPELTTSWRHGDTGTPFSDEALEAHRAAIEAARELVRFLDTGQQEIADRYLERIGRFFEIVVRVNPQRSAQLVDRLIKHVARLDQGCREEFAAVRQDHINELKPVEEVINNTRKRFDAVLGEADA